MTTPPHGTDSTESFDSTEPGPNTGEPRTRPVVLVTGATGGIGAAVAQAYARRGACLVLLARSAGLLDQVAAECRRLGADAGTQALVTVADVADAAAVEAAVARVADGLGAPTVLVNNAGITRDNLLFKMSETDWDAVMGVHLRGAFLMTRAVQQHMVAAEWGRIVNLSSTSALGNRGQANYATAKAGLQGFTKTLAIELGRFGITANCVAPGFIVSEMTRATAERLGEDWDTYVAARAAQIPVARAGRPEDIAHTVSFLVSEGAGFVSGQVLYVAGGPKS